MIRYTVAAFPEPLAVGSVVERQRWPAHITLAGNFFAAVTESRVVARVLSALGSIDTIEVVLGECVLFGASRDIPVLRADSAELRALHERLAGELSQLDGFTEDEPQFWCDAFVPHLTLGSTVSARPGEAVRIASVAVSRIVGGEAVVIGEIRASGGRDSN
ncbi:2'-5' RNA ligase family protein [Schumannella luteola]